MRRLRSPRGTAGNGPADLLSERSLCELSRRACAAVGDPARRAEGPADHGISLRYGQAGGRKEKEDPAQAYLTACAESRSLSQTSSIISVSARNWNCSGNDHDLV